MDVAHTELSVQWHGFNGTWINQGFYHSNARYEEKVFKLCSSLLHIP